MHGSYTRYVMESVRQIGEQARADGAKAAIAGEPREVPPNHKHSRLANMMWLLGYDTRSAI